MRIAQKNIAKLYEHSGLAPTSEHYLWLAS